MEGGALLSLVFAPGQRPGVEAIADLSRNTTEGIGFTISHQPPILEGWVELLAMGLTFDCRGLPPLGALPRPTGGALLGIKEEPEGETIALSPGPHLAEGAGMLPVVRALAGIGAQLASLPEVRAVCWHPAQCWMAPDYFRKVVNAWLADGAFPALGLTSLVREPNGAMVTVGIDLLIGQELYFEPDTDLAAWDIARIAVRLIHALIESGPLGAPHQFAGPQGESLVVTPVRLGKQLSVSVRK